MSYKVYRCDICGKIIDCKDFDHGASRIIIPPSDHFEGEDYETICSKCNRDYENS